MSSRSGTPSELSPEVSAEPSLAQVRACIPATALAPTWTGALRYVAVAWGALTTSLVFAALVWSRGWWLAAPLSWLFTGTGMMALFIIGHDAGHRAFVPGRLGNVVLGHLCFAPLLYSFYGWKYFHDAHHRRTNQVGRSVVDTFRGTLDLRFDTAFVPITHAEFRDMARTSRGLAVLYWSVRKCPSIAIALLPLSLSVLLRTRHLPSRAHHLWISRLVLVVTTSMLVALLVGTTGSLWALLHFWLLPHLVFCVWFGIYAYVQHTAVDVPVYDASSWTPTRGQLLGTVNVRFPRWLGVWHGHGDLHLPHHIVPTAPSYHMPVINDALRASVHGVHVREVAFSLSYLLAQVKACDVWAPEQARYAMVTTSDWQSGAAS